MKYQGLKPYFLRKIKVKNKVSSAAIFVMRFKGLRKEYAPKVKCSFILK